MENRACEICGHDDTTTAVRSSSIGAFSMNYCEICSIMGAEPSGFEVLMLNATENISEIGNAICLKYNVPAMMYFILETGEVIFSLRSTDDLHDVSKIAKAYSGGGHRNACGFKGDLNLLGMFLSGNPEAKEL
jgi:oligoribonuclease NrnB/cAMP/cGMP phosphodiesterase (DHH superfamily)